MKLDALLSTIILVSFLVTIMMAVGSYVAYKLREARRPHLGDDHRTLRALSDDARASGESVFFEQVHTLDVADAGLGARRE
ncbi:MAG: hypothetical protein M3Z10_12770 [Gemmatimonadota bacterium]|nr:hypothetical protein [Gemmatimonadota bacterium]